MTHDHLKGGARTSYTGVVNKLMILFVVWQLNLWLHVLTSYYGEHMSHCHLFQNLRLLPTKDKSHSILLYNKTFKEHYSGAVMVAKSTKLTGQCYFTIHAVVLSGRRRRQFPVFAVKPELFFNKFRSLV